MTDKLRAIKMPAENAIASLAALQMVAEGVRVGMLPPADSIRINRHGFTAHELLQWADDYQVEINIGDTAAWTTLPLLREEHGIELEVVLFSNDLSDAAKANYTTHNTLCLNPCADGRCPDPEMHAEGGHDR